MGTHIWLIFADFWQQFKHMCGEAALQSHHVVFDGLIECWVSPIISDDKRGSAVNYQIYWARYHKYWADFIRYDYNLFMLHFAKFIHQNVGRKYAELSSLRACA